MTLEAFLIMPEITCRSGYGGNTREPFVEVKWAERVLQLLPEEARNLALSLLATAEAAEQDAFLVEWGQNKVGLDLPRAAGLLNEYRIWRERRSSETEG